MNVAVWTLWLITYASSGSPAVSTLASYQSEHECLVSLESIGTQLRKEYGGKVNPAPGLMFCVYGAPAKR